MHNWYRISSLLLFSILLSACDEQLNEPEMDFGYGFFPTIVGQYKIYEVTEIKYEAQGGDTLHYFLKEQIIDTISHKSEVTYLLKREISVSDTINWEVSDVWSLRRDQVVGVMTEENVPYIKMSFPVYTGKEWNGNAFNTKLRQIYRYDEVDETEIVLPESDNLSSFVKVVIANIPKNLVNQDVRYEVYADGVGLIEKNYTILEFCTTNCSSEQINSGLKLEQVLIAYGKD